MDTGKLADMVEVFEGLEDWRSAQQTRHRLCEVLTVAVCAVLSGADDFEEISQWGRAKLPWLRGFLRLDYGVASPDTFERVFALLDPKQFEQAFRAWVAGIVPALGKDQVIAIDGKSSRRTTSKAAAAPLHLVSAFAANVGVVLGQTATAEKSNEITAIPELLQVLDIEGCIVTIDAMGTQTKIARAIRERGAHYVLCVKDNHPKLLDSIMFADLDPRGPLTPSSTHKTTSTGHGRTEVRSCTAYDVTDRLHKAEAWKDVASFAAVERVRTLGERTSTEHAYYISSLPADAERIALAIRSHWEVENRLHWCLDVQFGDDYARGRIGHIAHNLALVRHMALNLIRLDTSIKTSIKTKRLLAATSDEFRATLLGFETPDEDDDE
ncbi:ISAs1 family transposase [Aromatoleum toluclasticum]|uniref:ISAs1 family transposase n=1 Tax=Aromatoleum toluclasticum TaxID=92003 RepID=UPI0003662A94|nr:ISAs1 family transposase [Aromatoleum toluclasticum]